MASIAQGLLLHERRSHHGRIEDFVGPFAKSLPDRDAEIVTQLNRAGASCSARPFARDLFRCYLEQSSLWGGAQSVGFGPHSRRIERGLSRSRRRRAGLRRNRNGHGRIDSRSRVVLRSGGVEPTYGRLSRRGVMPLGLTLDHVGAIARTVRDVEACFWAMSGEAAAPASPAGRKPAPQASKSLAAVVGQVPNLPFSGPNDFRQRPLDGT